MSGHTPTPWRVDSVDPAFVSVPVNDGHNEDVIIECYSVDDGDGEISQMMARNNAAFIVRACNSHEALMNALNFYVMICGNTAASTTRQSAMEAYELAQAALALARGEQVKP